MTILFSGLGVRRLDRMISYYMRSRLKRIIVHSIDCTIDPSTSVGS